MRKFITITLIIVATVIYSQEYQKELIALDTIVGKTISSIERRDYHLFEFIDTLNYNYSQVFQINDSTFQLHISYLDSTVFDTIINQMIINDNKKNIFLLNAYYETLRNKKEDKIIKKEDIIEDNAVKAVNLYDPPIIYNANLYVVNAKHTKKLRIKKNQNFLFKIQNKSKNSININTMWYDEKYLGYIYARVKHININDSVILLSKKESGINEEFFVSFDEIIAIKQNTPRTIILKSIGVVKGVVIINPLMPIYFWPICLYNCVFKTKKFDMMDGDEFIVGSKKNNKGYPIVNGQNY
ncbi:MAG: hypothetical protein PF517_21135 [Salinivirgaceae bacterium]|jgi:hypothetical protein|nr:hypothetical protein [Salinivirgaceae bacterium]